MSLFVTSIAFGVITASVLAIGAVGFTLQAGVTNIVNFAYGSTMTACALIAWVANQAGLNLWLALVLAALFGAVFTALLNRLIYVPFSRRGTGVVSMIYVTIGAGLILEYALEAIWGPHYFTYLQSNGASFHVLSATFTTSQVAILAIAVATMVSVHLLLTRTQLGTAMRATAANRNLARNCGINTERVVDIAWALSGALCGIAGVVLAVNTFAFTYTLGEGFVVIIFAAAVLGGLGQPYGAMAGALIVGVVSEAAAGLTQPEYKDVIAFAILILVLLVRPHGVFSELSGRRGVVR